MKTSKSESTFLKTEIKKISVSIKNDIFRKKMKKCSNEVPIIPSKTLSFAHKQCFPKQFQNVDVQIWGQDPHFFSEIPKKTFSQPPPEVAEISPWGGRIFGPVGEISSTAGFNPILWLALILNIARQNPPDR